MKVPVESSCESNARETVDAVSSFNKSDLLPLSVGKAMIWLIPQHSYRVLRRCRHPEGMIPFHGHAPIA